MSDQTPKTCPNFLHAANCGAYPGSDEPCTCGLEWRIKLRTEQEMHAAWRKRAEEAEAQLADATAEVEKLREYIELVCRERDLLREEVKGLREENVVLHQSLGDGERFECPECGSRYFGTILPNYVLRCDAEGSDAPYRKCWTGTYPEYHAAHRAALTSRAESAEAEAARAWDVVAAVRGQLSIERASVFGFPNTVQAVHDLCDRIEAVLSAPSAGSGEGA